MIDSSSPNQPVQNYEIVNPTLEKQVSTLLPSVAGYGGNLRSTNTIIPIIDLTGAAEGSTIPNELTFAVSIDGDRFNRLTSGTNLDVSTTTGWNIVRGTVTFMQSDTSSTGYTTRLYLDDGTTEYNCFFVRTVTSVSVQTINTVNVEFIYFAKAGVSLKADVGNFSKVDLNVRQIMTTAEVLVAPTP
tara:strand:- start:515 stop:1075 length:561 start_codon:yes stop_codon:yes gene_type:complete